MMQMARGDEEGSLTNLESNVEVLVVESLRSEADEH